MAGPGQLPLLRTAARRLRIRDALCPTSQTTTTKARPGTCPVAGGGRRRASSSLLSSSHCIRPTYSLAVARDLPRSFPNALVEFAAAPPSPIDMDLARWQHQRYVDALRRFVPTLCLPALDDLPDSVFVEDTVVAVGGARQQRSRTSAVIARMGHPSRRPEAGAMRHVLTHQLGMAHVTDMRDTGGFGGGGNDWDDAAFAAANGREEEDAPRCDGGDVMYTGRHLFVGLSGRTNLPAVPVLERGLGLGTVPVPFGGGDTGGGALHLKSVVSHVDGNTLLAPEGALGDSVLEAMGATARGYTAIRLPSMLACNVVSVNGGVVAQDGGCEESGARLRAMAAERGLQIEFVDMSEYAKCDGALTCCSVLLDL